MLSLHNKISQIKAYIDMADSEINSLEGGKKSAAPRARKSLQEIKKLSHELRKNIVDHLKTLKPVKVATNEPQKNKLDMELEPPEVKDIDIKAIEAIEAIEAPKTVKKRVRKSKI